MKLKSKIIFSVCFLLPFFLLSENGKEENNMETLFNECQSLYENEKSDSVVLVQKCSRVFDEAVKRYLSGDTKYFYYISDIFEYLSDEKRIELNTVIEQYEKILKIIDGQVPFNDLGLIRILDILSKLHEKNGDSEKSTAYKSRIDSIKFKVLNIDAQKYYSEQEEIQRQEEENYKRKNYKIIFSEFGMRRNYRIAEGQERFKFHLFFPGLLFSAYPLASGIVTGIDGASFIEESGFLYNYSNSKEEGKLSNAAGFSKMIGSLASILFGGLSSCGAGDFSGTEWMFSSYFLQKQNTVFADFLWGSKSTFLINDFGVSTEYGVISPDGTSRYGLQLFYEFFGENTINNHRLILGSRVATVDISNSAFPGYLVDWRWTPDIMLSYSKGGENIGFSLTGAFQSSYNKPFDFEQIVFSEWSNRHYLLNVQYKSDSYSVGDNGDRSSRIKNELDILYKDGECMNSHGVVCVGSGNGAWWDFGTRWDFLFYATPVKWMTFYLTPFYQWNSVAPGSHHRFGSGLGIDFSLYNTANSDMVLSFNGIFVYHEDDDRYKPVSGGINTNFSILLY
jgi:hypothetical protein